MGNNINADIPIKQVYEDAIQPVTQATGKVLALLPRLIHAALLPIEIWINNKELEGFVHSHKMDDIKMLLENKCENVAEDKLAPPEPHVFSPAIRGIYDSMDCEELRNLYANLLAAAMNIDTRQDVHPAFAHVIAQMTPNEARIVQHMKDEGQIPTASFHLIHQLSDRIYNFESVIENVASIEGIEMSLQFSSVSLANLERLGIISISPSNVKNYGEQWVTDKDDWYVEIKNHPEIQAMCAATRESFTYPDPEEIMIRGIVSLTSFGKLLANICCD